MGKGRFNAVDVRAMSWELSQLLVGLRVSNIYDINPRTFLFKFAGDDRRSLLIIENGVRFHLTSFARDTTGMPNGFCQRLRKHLRGRRLTRVRQIGRDRVAVLTFGTNPDFQLHLVLELHSGGNIILCDSQWICLACLKTVVPPPCCPDSLPSSTAATTLDHPSVEGEEREEAAEEGESPVKSVGIANNSKTDKKESKTVRMREWYDLFGNTSADASHGPAIIEGLLRKELHKLIRNEKYLNRLRTHLKSGAISKRQLRKFEKSFGMSDCTVTVSDFLAKCLNCAPNCVSAMLSVVNDTKPEDSRLGGKDSLLDLAVPPYPLFEGGSEKLSQLLEKVSAMAASDGDDQSDEQDGSEDEEQLMERRELYDGMTEEEKVRYMRLHSNKLGTLFVCIEQFENMMRSMRVDPEIPAEEGDGSSGMVKGCIISKGVQLDRKQGRVKVKVKAARQKKEAPVIELEKSAAESTLESRKKSTLEVAFDSTDASGERRVVTEEEEESKQDSSQVRWMYDEFIPLPSCPVSGDLLKCTAFPSFAACVDEFYASTETLKQDMRQARSQALAWAKLEKARRQHDRHIDKLQSLADTEETKAETIRENLTLVDKALDSINGLLNEGVDWNDIAYLIKAGKESGNPVSCAISALKLHDQKITMKLTHKVAIYDESAIDAAIDGGSSESESGSESSLDWWEPVDWKEESVLVDLDLSMNAWNNASLYYAKKKVSLQKKVKTEEKTAAVMESAESRTRRMLEKSEEISAISKVRKAYWFEKFYWFISSDGFLVISGRDAQQNELIVKRYTDRERDIYVHALIHGASSVVIKNHLPKSMDDANGVPATTLMEAGHFCVCRSVAWRNGVSLQAYYVKASQVSKSAPSGEYLSTGSFIIRGKKKFMPQSKLEMGLTILFKLSDPKFADLNHANERCVNWESRDTQKMTEILREMDTSDDPLKKDSEVTVTRTLVHLTPQDRALKAAKEQSKQQSREERASMAQLSAKERRELRKQKKKAKKYGMKAVDSIAPASDSSAMGRRGKKKGRSKYLRKYGKEDQALVEELLGIKKQRESRERSEEIEGMTEEKGPEHEGVSLTERDQLPSKKHHRWDVVDLPDSDEESEDEETQRDRARLGQSLAEQLRLLTGRPQSESDEIEFALAMCAPLQSLERRYTDPTTGESSPLYDFVVKIQPGSVKRGSAVKTVQRMLEQSCDPWMESLVKSVSSDEISGVFLSDVKLSAPGLKRVEQSLKKKATAAAKQKWLERRKEEQAAIEAAKQRKEELAHVAPKKREKILRNARKKGK